MCQHWLVVKPGSFAALMRMAVSDFLISMLSELMSWLIYLENIIVFKFNLRDGSAPFDITPMNNALLRR